MKKLKNVVSILITTMTACCAIGILAYVMWGVGTMGDESCVIQVQNDSERPMTLKTFQYTNYDKKVTVDSLVLLKNEKVEIGRCIGCSTPDTFDIGFIAIGFYKNNGELNRMNRLELIQYLETKEKTGCITYLIK